MFHTRNCGHHCTENNVLENLFKSYQLYISNSHTLTFLNIELDWERERGMSPWYQSNCHDALVGDFQRDYDTRRKLVSLCGSPRS